jgi:hypothetical protein
MVKAQVKARTKGEDPKGQGLGQNKEKEINASHKVSMCHSSNKIKDANANAKSRHIKSPLKGGAHIDEKASTEPANAKRKPI